MILLKPQDVVLLLRLGIEAGQRPIPFATLGATLRISASEAHAGLSRAAAAGLLDSASRRPRVHNLMEFIEHGLRYVFISTRGEITRGFPTAFSAAPLAERLSTVPLLMRAAANAAGTPVASQPEIPLVWPHPEGTVRGEGFEPLYPSAVEASRQDAKLYECLALVDAIRIGRARERKLALDLLAQRLRGT